MSFLSTYYHPFFDHNDYVVPTYSETGRFAEELA